MDPLDPEVASALQSLIDRYRSRCLWFLAPGYYPATEAEVVRVLAAIERHGDREAFQRASEIRQWLSLSTSAASAGS